MSAIDEIKARLDIVNYIQQYVPLKKAGRTYKACCPFHNEKTPSFVVDADRQTWRCYGSCATGGDILSFAQKFHGLEFRETLTQLAEAAGIELEPQSNEQRERHAELDILRGLMQAAADFYAEQLHHAPDVLAYARKQRGFTDETLQRYQVGYAPDSWQATLEHLRGLGYEEAQILNVGLARQSENGRVYDYFRNRLIIPIRDERGRVVGFGARALSPDDTPKYLNSPQTPLFDKSRLLFGLDTAKNAIRDTEIAIIVEGYMDAVQAQQAGYLNVVAQMGTALTEQQLKLIAPRWAKQIILALDADAAGQNATMRSLDVIQQVLKDDLVGRLSVDMRVLHLPNGKDPDDFIRETPGDWPQVVQSAIPVADYVIEMEMGKLPSDASVQQREAVARRLLPILSATESTLYRQDNLQKLALRLRIDEQVLLNWAHEQQQIERSRPPRPNYSEAMPEPPPIDYTDAMMPYDDGEDYGDGFVLDHVPAPAQPSIPRQSTHAPLESSCLRALYQDPSLMAWVNRKFRELAVDYPALLDGPLADLSAEDFNNTDYQMLMRLLQQACDQDECAPADYLDRNLDPLLRQVVQHLTLDDFNLHALRIGNRMTPDLNSVVRQIEGGDKRVELIRNALELRRQRLERERKDIYFLAGEAMGDDFAYETQTRLSIRAKRIIEEELQQLGKRLY